MYEWNILGKQHWETWPGNTGQPRGRGVVGEEERENMCVYVCVQTCLCVSVHIHTLFMLPSRMLQKCWAEINVSDGIWRRWPPCLSIPEILWFCPWLEGDPRRLGLASSEADLNWRCNGKELFGRWSQKIIIYLRSKSEGKENNKAGYCYGKPVQSPWGPWKRVQSI